MTDDFPGWYAYACLYVTAHPMVRVKVPRQTLAHYRRIKRYIPPAIGQELDQAQAPFFIVRWIAWGDPHELRLTRYATALEHRDRTGRWLQWRALAACASGATADADPVRIRGLLHKAHRLAELSATPAAPPRPR
jgi:hypothetical protein